jgi:hypothetical protein
VRVLTRALIIASQLPDNLQIECLTCVAALHEACPGALPSVCQQELDVLTCLVAHQAAACCQLHRQHGTLHAGAAASQVHVASTGCLAALARAASARHVPVLSHVASLLGSAAEFGHAKDAARAGLAAVRAVTMVAQGMGGAMGCAAFCKEAAEAAEADLSLSRKVTALLAVRSLPSRQLDGSIPALWAYVSSVQCMQTPTPGSLRLRPGRRRLR